MKDGYGTMYAPDSSVILKGFWENDEYLGETKPEENGGNSEE